MPKKTTKPPKKKKNVFSLRGAKKNLEKIANRNKKAKNYK